MTACRYEVKPFSTLQRWHKHTAPLDTRWTHEGGNPQVGSVPVPADAISRSLELHWSETHWLVYRSAGPRSKVG